ncbi:MAG: CAP domain-containing protein [Nitrososphaera sp.]
MADYHEVNKTDNRWEQWDEREREDVYGRRNYSGNWGGSGGGGGYYGGGYSGGSYGSGRRRKSHKGLVVAILIPAVLGLIAFAVLIGSLSSSPSGTSIQAAPDIRCFDAVENREQGVTKFKENGKSIETCTEYTQVPLDIINLDNGGLREQLNQYEWEGGLYANTKIMLINGTVIDGYYMDEKIVFTITKPVPQPLLEVPEPIGLSTPTASEPKTEPEPEQIENEVPPTYGIITSRSSYSIEELRTYALDLINEDRADYGLAPVELSNNAAAQVYAEDNLENMAISHWLSNGEKPYMTYTRHGGLGYMAQNIASSFYDSDSMERCESDPTYYCQTLDPKEEIEAGEYGMIYEDRICCDNGHRDNILDPAHTHVSIGIAYNDYGFFLVQNFEDNLLAHKTAPKYSNGYVMINADTVVGKLYSIGIYFDEKPTPELYAAHADDTFYEMGELVAVVAEPADGDWYYEEPEDYILIEASSWKGSGNDAEVTFRLDKAFKEYGSGVYTAIVWVEDGEELIPAMSYSITREY